MKSAVTLVPITPYWKLQIKTLSSLPRVDIGQESLLPVRIFKACMSHLKAVLATHLSWRLSEYNLVSVLT